MNSELAVSPAKSALVHQETGPLRSRILDQYQKWKGTQYRWGGTTHRGVDCSALMQHLFSDAHTLICRAQRASKFIAACRWRNTA